MSRTASSPITSLRKVIALLVFLGTSTLALKTSQTSNANPSWNYDKHGTDWDFSFCNNTEIIQSPIAFNDNTQHFDWSEFATTSFLTAWQVPTITSDKHGFYDYVYRINATDGNMGVFYGTEPFPFNAQVMWTVDQIRFHYPSEHIIMGKQYALEMQIVLNDTLKQAQFCTAHEGALSIFFDVDDSSTNSFWDWIGQDEFTIDLNQVFTKTTAIQSQMYGYAGTDTMPNCKTPFCWYLNVPAGTITQAQLDQLKLAGQEWNNRQADITSGLAYRFLMDGLLYTPPSSEL